MAEIVAESRQAQTGTQHRPPARRREWKPPKTTIECHTRKVHCTKRMDISGVGGSGERQVGEAQLTNSPQPLHHGVVNDREFTRRHDDRAMDGVTDFQAGLNMNRHADN